MTNNKTDYNPHLINLVKGSKIAYDSKVNSALGEYINDNLWENLDDDFVGKVVLILDDPQNHYDNDQEMLKKLLRSFLKPTKEKLKLNDDIKLKDSLNLNLRNKGLIDRQINNWLEFYRTQKSTQGLISKVIQDGGKTKIELTNNGLVPQTQKSIIANLLILIILQEELNE